LGSKKNQKTFGAAQAPNPGALGGAGHGSTKNKTQKDFVNFEDKIFSFAFLIFVLHETKNLSRIK